MASSPEPCANHEDSVESESCLIDSQAASQIVIAAPLFQISTGSDEADQNEGIECLCLSQMEAEQRQPSIEFPINEIPEPIKVLDDIISEFEDTSKPASANGGENQSEDDGYMSLSRKNMHKRDFENMSENSIVVVPPKMPSHCFLEFDHSFTPYGDCTKKNTKAVNISTDQTIIQSTLPKTRPTSKVSTNYSSLPCCGVRSGSMESKIRGCGSCNGERNALGIDISAVHNAVIRGGLAKLPEPILNEHPVTIYPGRYSPPTDGIRGNRPLRLLSSVEKHKEVCQILNPLSSISSSSSSSSHSNSAVCSSDIKTLEATPIMRLHKETAEYKNCRSTESENDEFSEDSTEEQTISPLMMPSFLSTTQLTPNKQCGIAWEIHFNNDTNRNKTFKSLLSLSSKRKSGRKHINENINSANELYLPKCVKPATQNAGTEDGGFNKFGDSQDIPYSNELFGYGMHSHTNMLGKGTFIIRKTTKTKALPKAIDIFSDTTLDSIHIPVDNTNLKECDRNDSSARDSNDTYRKNDVINTNRKHDLDIEGISQISSLSSPRDRLSLNLESQHNSSLKKEATSALAEEFSKSCNKGSSKMDRSQPVQEAINKCSSLGEEDLCDVAKANVANNFDSGNIFPYKINNTNGLKNQEYSDLRTSNTTTPHTDLAPTLEEEEDQYSDQFSYGCAPLQQIESNISALLRGEITVVRAGDANGNAISGAGPIIGTATHPKRSLEFRPGVHKSESAKEMLLSQNAFGPLPPSPPSSNPDLFDYDALPPLPPLPSSPQEIAVDNNDIPKAYMKTTTTTKTSVEIHSQSQPPVVDERKDRDNIGALRHLTSDLPLPPPPFDTLPPAVPPHRGHSANTIKSWSIDSNYKRKSPKMLAGYGSGSSITTPTGSHATSCEGGSYSTKRYVSYGTKRSLKQSPREELRLQTSCSLPETPIFARGCDIPRTPFRRQNENTVNGSRTAPRSSTSHSINMGTSIVGIAGGNTFGSGMCRQRSINHALASNEMLRLSGVPARGWYPKQRSMRPASTENIDRLTSIRVWDSATGMSSTGHARKPLTLPPNLTPSFLNKSPREALRRVTSLLITKKRNTKERKAKITYDEIPMERNNIVSEMDTSTSTKDTIKACNISTQKPQKKKGIFKNLWKRTKHFSLDQ